MGPDNLEQELKNIASVAGDSEIWIDAETKLRTNNKFDLNKCIKVLDIVNKYIKECERSEHGNTL